MHMAWTQWVLAVAESRTWLEYDNLIHVTWKSASVWVMAFHLTDDRSFPESEWCWTSSVTLYDGTFPQWVTMTSLSRCPPIQIIDSLMSRYALPNQTIIGSDGGLSPVRCQAIVGTNTGLLSTGPLRTYIWNNRNILTFIVEKYAKRNRCLYNGSHLCLGLNVLI